MERMDVKVSTTMVMVLTVAPPVPMTTAMEALPNSLQFWYLKQFLSPYGSKDTTK